MKSLRGLNLFRFSLPALSIAVAISAHATDRTWNNVGGSNTWSTAGLGGAAATNATNGAVFYDPAATDLNVNVSGNVNTGYIIFNASAIGSVNINTSAGSIRLSNGNGSLIIGVPSSGTPSHQISGSGNLIVGVTSESGATSFAFTNSSANLFTISAPILFSQGSAAITRSLLFNGAGDFTISGVISESGVTTAPIGNITKSNTGILTLSSTANAYTGTTTVSGGVLSVTKLSNGGATSSIGASTSAAANLIINGGTLRYTGTGNGTDRLFTVGTGAAATLEANGTGALNFTNTTALAYAGSGTRTLTLSGTNTAGNTLASAIGDGAGGATSVVKSGAGNWVISGSSNYTGGTTVNSGTLTLGNAQAMGSSTSAVTSNGGVLNLGGFAVTTGTATFAGGSVTSGTLNSSAYVAQSGGVSAVLAGSGALTKSTSGTLTLTGNNTYSGSTTVSAGTLRAGSANALAGTSSITVASGGLLQVSASGAVNDSAAITLSGGTILRDSGVNEVFGNLAASGTSTIDFGSGTVGTLTFGLYTPSSLINVANFVRGNSLVFGSDLTGIFSSNYSSYFDFGGHDIRTSWSGSQFTIASVPEPTALLAGALMLGVVLWPQRRRLAPLWRRAIVGPKNFWHAID